MQSPFRHKCKKCKSIITVYRELFGTVSGSIIFEKHSDKNILCATMHNPPEPNPIAVYAICACGHEWRLRGIRQIIELGIPIEH